jgi:N-acetyl-anhydromuramyl-L-alanine amidase AmpD
MSLKRIVIHWSAGSHKVSSIDKEHYHYIVDGEGKVHKGDHSVQDNLSTSDGIYAAHTRGANAGAIGVAMAGMMDAQGPGKLGKYPLTKVQWDACMALVKKLAKEHGIPVTRSTVLTHAEVEGTLGIKQAGKIDIAFGVPGHPELKSARACGDFIRASVA